MSGADVDSMDRAHLQLRFFHLHKLAFAVRGGISQADTDRVSELLSDTTASRRAEIHAEFSAAVREAAQQLLEDPEVRSAVDTLPFRTGETVVALGDSITDDLVSWASILGQSLSLGRPDLGVTVLNAGFTGDTTQNAIARFDTVALGRPHWVLQMLGTNDIRRHGQGSIRMSTLGETTRNLHALRELVEQDMDARLVVLTPPPVDEQRVRAWAPFSDESILWTAAEIDQLADVIRTGPGPVIDVHRALQSGDLGAILLPDGLHPTLEGQRRIARTVLLGLAALEP